MTESKTTCDICGEVIPPFEYVSKFIIPYQTMELHMHPGDKYSCDFCAKCAVRFAGYIEKMKDIRKKVEVVDDISSTFTDKEDENDENELMCLSCKYGNNQTILRCKYCDFSTNWINYEPKDEWEEPDDTN